MTATLFEPPHSRAGITPREYQIESHDGSFKHWDAGTIGVLTRAATGTGKTLMACLCMDTWLRRGPNYRCLVISYETQLVWQFAQEVEDYLGLHAGIEMAQEAADSDHVPLITVASRQSLLVAQPADPEQVAFLASLGIPVGSVPERTVNRVIKYLKRGGDPEVAAEEMQQLNLRPEAANGKWSRVHKFDALKYNWLVVLDEAHRWSYRLVSVGHIVDWFERNKESRRLGITATPKRGDGVSIGHKMFPAVALDFPLFARDKPCALSEGYSVPYVQRYIEVEGVDFAQLAKVAGDFDEGELERVLGEESMLAKLVEPALDMVGDRRTLIFSPGVEMAKNVARYINARSRVKCTCGKEKWHPTLLIGDGAKCPACGRLAEPGDIDKSGDQARELDGAVPHSERKQVYAEHKASKFQFLSVCGLCIAKGTMILTDQGEVPIEDVTTDLKLWDGVDFVSHDGVVSKGIKPVIEYAGLTATGDHNVWTDDGWVSLAACQERRLDICVSGIGGHPVRESDGYYRNNHSSWQAAAARSGGAVQGMRQALHQGLRRAEERPGRLQIVREVVGCASVAATSLPGRKQALQEPGRRGLSRLRRPGCRVSLLVSGGNGVVDYGEPGAAQGVDAGPQKQQRSLRAGQHPVGQSNGAGEQQTAEAEGVSAAAEVFDILNAGPRHRFTANGLIVSNCREGYNDSDLSAVVILRPISEKASSLAEQIKGRGSRPHSSIAGKLHNCASAEERRAMIAASVKPDCLIVDLVGATRLADCASTLMIYADGLEDEVIERAEEILVEAGLDQPIAVEDAIEQAQRESDENKAKIREERERAERLARELAEKRAKAGAQVTYSAHEVGVGSNVDTSLASPGQYRMMIFLGLEITGREISKRQAGRMIGMLKRRMPAEQVAIENRIAAENFRVVGPTIKQLSLLQKRKVRHDWVKSQSDANVLISAILNPGEVEKFFEKSFQYVRDDAELNGLGTLLKMVNQSWKLPPDMFARIAAVGRMKRDQFRVLRVRSEEPLPE